MIISVSSQAYIFLCSIAGGMAIALVYDFFRIFRKAVKTGSLVTYVQDLLFWLIVAVIMFLTIYYSNDGELRVYLFIGALLGVVLYALLLSRIVMGSSLFIIRMVAKVIKAIIFLITYPARFILRLLKIPARKLARSARKSVSKVRSNGKVRLSKLTFLKKTFKNIRKKI
jgi:spore cortex biosynthesis protein YabQ